MERTILKPSYAFSLFLLLNVFSLKFLGTPFFFGAVDTYNSTTGAADPMDGRVRLDPVGSVWNTERTKASGDGGTELNSVDPPETGKDASGNFQFKRVAFIFNTSGIASTDSLNQTADSNFKATRSGVAVSNGDSGRVALVQFKSTNDAAIAGANFSAFGPPFPVATGAMTEGSDTTQNMSGLSVNTQFTWTLNATGVAWVGRSGETKPTGAAQAGRTRMAFVEGRDATDTAYAGANSTLNSAEFLMRDNGSNYPVLSVDHGSSGTASPMTLLGVG